MKYKIIIILGLFAQDIQAIYGDLHYNDRSRIVHPIYYVGIHIFPSGVLDYVHMPPPDNLALLV